MSKYLLASLSLTLLASCMPASSTDSASSRTSKQVDDFASYWYAGEAEITSYNLEQARYGELRAGSAVLIFVTEDFSRTKLTKINNPAEYSAPHAAKVLKLNTTTNYKTGIYPYSTMTSAFSDVNETEHSLLKVTASSQEWCGHTYSHLALRKNKYDIEQHSYFEEEGDRSFELPAVESEDGIWNQIRIDPNDLPTGSFEMIPGLIYQRYGHTEWKTESVTATLTRGDQFSTYELDYADSPRRLAVTFATEFPHEIESWEETRLSGFGDNRKELTTRAVKNKRIKIDYWNRNSNSDAILRSQLGLE